MSLFAWRCWEESDPSDKREILARCPNDAAEMAAEQMDEGSGEPPVDTRIMCVQQVGFDRLFRYEVEAEARVHYSAWEMPEEGGAS